MANFNSGIFDRTRLVSNILMLALVGGNIFFSVQYSEEIKAQASATDDTTSEHYLAVHALNDFINIVLSQNGPVSYDDRVKLENDILQVDDSELTADWQAFVASPDAATAQTNAVKIMSVLGKLSV